MLTLFAVGSCKQRWRNIRTTFARSLVGSPKKRKGNRAREHNLHDVLEFLIPHINDGTDAPPFRESADEAENLTTRVDNKTVENRATTNNTEATTRFLKEDVKKREIEELNEMNKNEVEIKIREELSTDDDNVDAASKRPSTARLKVLRKTNDEIKVTDVTRSVRKTQSLGKIVKIEENKQDIVEAGLIKKLPNSKSKVGTFYISPTNSESGTFFIKKNNSTSSGNELENTSENAANMTAGGSILCEYELNDSKLPESKVDESEVEDQTDNAIKTRQCRFKRACKRGLGKKATNQRDMRQKDSAAKSIRRGTTRLNSLGEATKQLIAVTKLAKKIRHTAPAETQTTSFPMHKKTRTLCIPQADTTIVGSQQSTISLIKQSRHQSSFSTAEKITADDANTSSAYIDQGIQCVLQPTSSDDDFFDTLKPYLSEMNARQKLHFKKKIFESLIEVFDSTSDFPAIEKANIIPKQLSAVSGDELHLVRELVAMVQAAKHTPELNLNLSGGSSELAHKTSTDKCAIISPNETMRFTPSQPPPPLSLRVSPFNATTTANKMTNRPTPTLLTSAGMTSTKITTSTSPSSPVVQRRVIRKLVKVNDLSASAYNMPTTSAAYAPSNSEIVHRRIYRIFPKSDITGASLENAVNASGVGTFIVPRSTAEDTANKAATGNKLTTSASPTPTSNTTTIQKLRQLVTPVGGVGRTPTSPARSANATVKSGCNPSTISVGARPLMRRYSVCGAPPNVNEEHHTASSKYLTTTANTKESVSTTPKITIAHRCSPAHVVSREVFKLPTPFRSTISGVNATTSAVATNMTSSRTSPVVSVSTGDRNLTVRTIPLSMGFNKFMGNDEKTTPLTSSGNTKACRDSSSSPHLSRLSPLSTTSNQVVGNKRSLAMPTEYGKRNSSIIERRKVTEAVSDGMADMGIIASDDFAVLNIKTEPGDYAN